MTSVAQSRRFRNWNDIRKIMVVKRVAREGYGEPLSPSRYGDAGASWEWKIPRGRVAASDAHG